MIWINGRCVKYVDMHTDACVDAPQKKNIIKENKGTKIHDDEFSQLIHTLYLLLTLLYF